VARRSLSIVIRIRAPRSIGIPIKELQERIFVLELTKSTLLLGLLYVRGQGVTQDFILAYMWLNIGASSLSGEFGEQAATVRDRVAKKMKPGQIERAQEMARKCQASCFWSI